jgi:hypothetical protein
VGGRDLYVPRYADEDGDGVGAGPIEPVCPGEPGYAVSNGDCDDADPARFPGNPEVCDGVDNNCAEDLRDEGRLDHWQDLDGDSFGAGPLQNACPGALDATWVHNADDCDDADAAIRPGAREECNYEDDNCNGMSDELALRLPHWGDQDGDGWGGPPAPEPACDLPNDPLVRRSGDCDDGDPAAYPGAPELCDEVDQSCDGRVDDDGRQTWYYDGDRDGIGGDVAPGPLPVYPPTVCEELLPYPERWTQRRGDCDDADPSIRPGVAERCDRIDSNCNGWADEPTTPHFPDRDGDLAGQQGVPSAPHCPGEPGWVENQRDCDDTDPNRRLGAPELCDEVDQDCDGDVRDDGRQVWYYDGDRDGYGVTLAGQSPRDVCVSLLPVPTQWSNRGGDCDDRSRSIHPTAVDPCDEVDQDCDGNPYEEVLTAATIDVDHDGYGDPNTASVDVCANQLCRLLDPVLGIVDDNAHPNDACWVPTVSNPQMHDCDDDDADVHPNAEETCDGKRNSCDPCTDIDPVCAGATRFEWEGSVYQVKLDRSDPRAVVVETETWADGADWCHGRGYKMWWPTQRVAVLITEPWALAVNGSLYYEVPTVYHTGIRAGCPDGTEPAGTTTSVWSLWDGTEGAAAECVPLSATAQGGLGLADPAAASSVAQITIANNGLPAITSDVRTTNSYGVTVCELDGTNLLPAENPACLAP